MSTQDPQQGQQPAPPQPSTAEPGQPRDDSGRFQAPQPPTMQQPAGPAPPTVAPPEVDAQQAIEFYQAFRDPQRQAQQLITTGQQYGLIPPDLTAEDVVSVLRDASAYKRQQMQPQQQQTPQAPYAGPLPGYQPPQAPQAAPMPQQAPPLPDGGYDPYDAYGYAPQAQDPRMDQMFQMLQEMQQKDAEREQQETGRAQQERIESIRSAAASVLPAEMPEAERTGLSQIIAVQMATGIDQAVQAGQGHTLDFRPEALNAYAEQLWGTIARASGAVQQANHQQQVLQHRGIAPSTTVPGGEAQAGQSTGPRGPLGAAARVKAAMAARAAGQ